MNKAIKDLRNCKTRPEADAMIGDVFGVIDKASRHNIIHQNKAARDKSRLMAFISKISG
jgi:ribosomal protein S20